MPHIFDLNEHMRLFSFINFVQTKIALSIVNLVEKKTKLKNSYVLKTASTLLTLYTLINFFYTLALKVFLTHCYLNAMFF